MRHTLLSAAVVLCSATPPVFAETVQVVLTQNGVVTSTASHPVTPDGHDLIFVVSEWEAPRQEESVGPFRGLNGTCFETTEFKDDTIVGGGGYCTYTDSDADRLVTRWVPTERVVGQTPHTRGKWEVFEGSGKWEAPPAVETTGHTSPAPRASESENSPAVSRSADSAAPWARAVGRRARIASPARRGDTAGRRT